MVVNQEQLEALSGSTLGSSVTSLTFGPDYDECEADAVRELRQSEIDFGEEKIRFPALTSLELGSQGLVSIKFSKERTPLLAHLSIERPCNRAVSEFDLDLPELETLHLEFVTVYDASNFGASLSRSPKLDQFTGYKVWGLGVGHRSRAHRLILASCTQLKFRRSDDIDHLVLWAPRLQSLNLQAAYAIESVRLVNRIEILEPLAARDGPEAAAEHAAIAAAATAAASNEPPARYHVNVAHTRAGISDFGPPKDIDGNILSHPRCAFVQRVVDDYLDSGDEGPPPTSEPTSAAALEEADRRLLLSIQEDLEPDSEPESLGESSHDYSDDDF